MKKNEVKKRIEEIYRELNEIKKQAAESCEAEGYPSNGSNYDLRVESWSEPLYEELEELKELEN